MYIKYHNKYRNYSIAQSQWTLAYIKILKEVTIKAIKSRISKAKELTVKGVEAKPKILIEEDV